MAEWAALSDLFYAKQGLPIAVIERDHLMLASAQLQGVPTIEGDAAAPGVLNSAGLDRARLLVVATPDSFQARRIVEVARARNPTIDVVVRTHKESEFEKLEKLGAGRSSWANASSRAGCWSIRCAVSACRPNARAPLPDATDK